jgi:hypothetical protein
LVLCSLFFVLGAPELSFRLSQALFTKHQAQSTKHKAQSTKHQAQSTKHKARRAAALRAQIFDQAPGLAVDFGG